MTKTLSLMLTAAILACAALLPSHAQEVNPVTSTVESVSVPASCQHVSISTFAPTSIIVSTNAAARFIDILNVDTNSNWIAVDYSSVTISTSAGSAFGSSWQLYPVSSLQPNVGKRFPLAPRQQFYALSRGTTQVPVWAVACPGR